MVDVAPGDLARNCVSDRSSSTSSSSEADILCKQKFGILAKLLKRIILNSLTETSSLKWALGGTYVIFNSQSVQKVQMYLNF